ncbi:MAG TPA: Lrp/AsnC ligand binding domain-containing protein [Candidatus Atribacteria bacterium]|nr:Lrp/AsnC ligand binding domain-containing protein [Candidatus Atribacteria bacterium]
MSVQAYILVQVQTGRAQAIKKELAQLPQFLRVDRVMGPFDIIALVEVENNREIGELILKEIQSLNGVKRTLTCPVIP